ncbi:MAG: response regulator [Candidatus Wallbacteria bacterium]|nr:response regulator [Candidatus Wallbacteria bacterium]
MTQILFVKLYFFQIITLILLIALLTGIYLLYQKIQELSKRASLMAHEVKNHFWGILLQAEIGLDESTTAKKDEYLRRITAAAGESVKLVELLEAQPRRRENSGSIDQILKSEKTFQRNFTGTALLVEDQEIFRSLGEKMLGRMGFKVLAAGSGVQALGIFRVLGKEISLVLLDIQLPDMKGTEIFRNLREINPAVRILLVSGGSLDQEIFTLIQDGTAGFLSKPFDELDLVKGINHILT